MNKKIRKIISTLLISISSVSVWEVGKKQYMYINNKIEHTKLVNEMKKAEDIQEYLYDKPYDWISVSNTVINYPLVKAEDAILLDSTDLSIEEVVNEIIRIVNEKRK